MTDRERNARIEQIDHRIFRAVEIEALIQLRQEQIRTELNAIKSLKEELEKL